MIAHVRTVFQGAWPDTWRSELIACFGQQRWSEVVLSAKRAEAAGVRDTPPVDEFDYMGALASFTRSLPGTTRLYSRRLRR